MMNTPTNATTFDEAQANAAIRGTLRGLLAAIYHLETCRQPKLDLVLYNAKNEPIAIAIAIGGAALQRVSVNEGKIEVALKSDIEYAIKVARQALTAYDRGIDA